MTWFETNPHLLQNIKKQLRKYYPTLHVVIDKNKVFMRGGLFITVPKTQKEIDRFGIEIELPDDYPSSVPLIREIENRIPKIMDRHFLSNGVACLFFRDEQYKFYNKNTSIVEFIQISVYNFFLSQSYFEMTGKWLFGEWSHGKPAVWEYYAEELGTDDIDTIGRFLCFLSADKLDVKQECYCGNRKLLVNCHISKVAQMRKVVPLHKARASLKDMWEMKERLVQAIKGK